MDGAGRSEAEQVGNFPPLVIARERVAAEDFPTAAQQRQLRVVFHDQRERRARLCVAHRGSEGAADAVVFVWQHRIVAERRDARDEGRAQQREQARVQGDSCDFASPPPIKRTPLSAADSGRMRHSVSTKGRHPRISQVGRLAE